MKANLKYAEFYVTNHCNISCNNCNRFNNHKLTGSAKWDMYRNRYKEWSQIVDINRIALLGGEPLLHHQLDSMLNDVRLWWPNSKIEITTNGLLINKLKPSVIKSIIDNNITVYVSIHNENWHDKIKKSIIDLLGQLTYVNGKRLHPKGGHDEYVAASGNRVILEYTYYFRSSALKQSNNKMLELHSSDPDKAHTVCDMKMSHHFWKGNLYKCGVMVALPYMLHQKSNMLNISEDQKKLLKSYRPLMLSAAKNNPSLVGDLANSIAQCTFCPESYNNTEQKIFND